MKVANKKEVDFDFDFLSRGALFFLARWNNVRVCMVAVDFRGFDACGKRKCVPGMCILKWRSGV